MSAPSGAAHRAAYDALMRDLLRRAAARIAAQNEAASDWPSEAAATEVRDDAAVTRSSTR